MMWWDGGCGMGAGGVLWMVVMLAVLVLIVVGIVLLVRGLSGGSDRRGESGAAQVPGAVSPAAPAGNTTPPGAEAALRLLQERYARGEIDRDEFLQKKSDLLS